MRPSHVGLIAAGVLAAMAPSWPSDWDGVGFVEAVTSFDLARFAPHPPGYPVYVLASRVAHLVARDASRACGLASALGGALVVWALARAASRAPLVALLSLASPVLALASVSARSDALGLGLAAAACACRAPVTAGALLSLSLGARPSYVVLVGTLGALGALRWTRRELAGATAAFALVSALWGAGLLVASGGVGRYIALTRAQAAGHFGDWGGSAWTRSSHAARASDFARALGDCFALEASWAGALRGLAWAALAVIGARALGRRHRLSLAAATLPYAVATYWTQNVGAEPRHLLPVALALLALAVVGAAELWTRVRSPGRVALLAVCGLCAAPSARALWAQRTQPPVGVAMGRYVARLHPRGDALVFGGRSSRVVQWAGQRALPATRMGEVDLTLERLDRLPRHVHVTSEVAWRERARGTFGAGVRFCHNAVSGRAGACVTLFPYDVLGR